MRHLVSTKELTKLEVASILDLAARLEKESKQGKLEKLLRDKIVACAFFEPSTRTRLSFETAALRLGAKVISIENGEISSSVVKGESIEDTAQMLSTYADLVVLRHPEGGAARRAADISSKPVINAGDGANEHPTQALLDLYTIKKELGRLSNLSIAYAGDLLYSRPLHSIMPLFSAEDKNIFYFISPSELKLPADFKQELKHRKIIFKERNNLLEILPEIDVLYVTRVQKERFADSNDYEKVKNSFILKNEDLKKLKKEAIIMHALPRVNEIEPAIDQDSRAAYFRQPENGLYVRMAILLHCFTDTPVPA